MYQWIFYSFSPVPSQSTNQTADIIGAEPLQKSKKDSTSPRHCPHSAFHNSTTDPYYTLVPVSGFSTLLIADFSIGIRQFLLLPNSTMTILS